MRENRKQTGSPPTRVDDDLVGVVSGGERREEEGEDDGGRPKCTDDVPTRSRGRRGAGTP